MKKKSVYPRKGESKKGNIFFLNNPTRKNEEKKTVYTSEKKTSS